MVKNTSKTLDKTKDKGAVTDMPNPFVAMRQMLAYSVGRLPAKLVILLLLSVSVASLTAIMMGDMIQHKKAKEFMPQRLAVQNERPPLDETSIQGVWTTQHEYFLSTITLTKNKFEWIVKMKAEPQVKYYLRGNYRLEGNILILGARSDMGRPTSNEPGKRPFLQIGMADLNAYASVEKDKMTWVIPVDEQQRYVSRFVTLFNYKDDAHYTWERME